MPDTLSTRRKTDPVILALGWALFIFSLFPYFLIFPIQTDTQPYAVICAAFIFLIGYRVSLPLPIWLLFVMLAAATAVFAVTGSTFNGLRSLVGYASVFLISASVLILDSARIRLSDRLLDVSVAIWFTVGAIQRFLAPDFLTFALARSQTSDTRGVVALAVEPSAYATMMLFIIAIYFLRGRERSWPVLLCLVQIIIFSQSSLGILFVLAALGLYTLIRFSAPAAILSLLVLFLLFYLIFTNAENLLAGTRFGAILNMLATRPQALFALDQSVSARVSSIFYSLKGAFDGWFAPHGFDAWAPYADQQDQIYRDIFVTRGLSGDRIMSGYGAALFELGVLGLMVPVVITIGVLRRFGMRHLDRAIALLLMIHTLILMPVPLSLPMVGILVGEIFVRRTLGAFPVWSTATRLRPQPS